MIINCNRISFKLYRLLLIDLRTLSDKPRDTSSNLRLAKDKRTPKAISEIVKEKTPVGRLDKIEQEKHRDAEKEPLPQWPESTNPETGEKGGPKGPEPTRYGDWERKGRVTDF